VNENSAELALFIPENLDYFNGHFPDAPILAGVVQLHWAVEYAKQVFNLANCEVVNLEVLKFQVVIVPKQNLVLTLTRKSNDKVLFSYVSERGQHASGRIVFEYNVCESKT
jgi:3-hydroxymyristoyl/3-hydroxydecanoyl-(acyl carrier protein) dehydratase